MIDYTRSPAVELLSRAATRLSANSPRKPLRCVARFKNQLREHAPGRERVLCVSVRVRSVVAVQRGALSERGCCESMRREESVCCE